MDLILSNIWRWAIRGSGEQIESGILVFGLQNPFGVYNATLANVQNERTRDEILEYRTIDPRERT